MPFERLPFAEAPRRPQIAGGSVQIALLDAAGVIVVVNQAWRATVTAHGVDLRNAGIGSRYVDVARKFLPDLDETVLERSLSRLGAGETDLIRHTFAITTPRGPRWRQVQITPLSHGTAGRFVATHEDMTDLVETREALRLTTEHLLSVRDEERQRIALELHDSTSQHLATISLGLARLRRATRERATIEIIDEIAMSLDEAVKETRILSYLMKPTELAGEGLAAGARAYLDGFTRRTGLEGTFKARVGAVPGPVQHAAMRITQEALANVYRHAHARRVTVELATDDDFLTVSISDDGCGMYPGGQDPPLGVGIPGMRARAEQLRGRLEISSDEFGARVVATLPLV